MNTTVQKPRILVVGGGAMGGALVRGWLADGLVAPADLLVVDPSAAVRGSLGAHGVEVRPDAAGLTADLWVLAVKPQLLQVVLAPLAAQLKGQTAVSIAAGVSLRTLADCAPGTHWVRAMPNQPAVVRAGATGLFASAEVAAEARALVERLFAAVGAVVWVEREELMHAVTGLAGSGPAFVAVVAEALEDAGVAAGLSRAAARLLARRTIGGTAAQLEGEDLAPATLKDRVTSPGGTTIAGLAAAEDAGLRAAVQAAVFAAVHRSRELGGDE